jgi:CRP-like cAMP-binding protein
MINRVIEYVNQFMPLNEAEFQRLLSITEECEYEKNTILTRIGEVEQYMYFIVKGLVRKFFYKGKVEIITHILSEGGLIGSGASFLSGKPSLYIVETLEPSTLLRIQKDKLEALFQSEKKWEKFGRLITASYFLGQEKRNMDNIRFSAKERFIHFMNENPDMIMRVPQKYLAAYLNIKPETFSRMKHLLNPRK